MKPSNAILRALTTAASLLLSLPSSWGADWIGGTSGNWNVSGNWNPAIPNSIGAVANFTSASTTTVTQDISGGATVGTISMSGAANNQLIFTLTNGITLNQDGAGSGVATISNSASGVSSRLFLQSGGSSVTIGDNLLITNTSSSTRTFTNGGSISLSAVLAGSGNVTFSNVSNDIASGAISAGAASSYTGAVTIQKGAVGWGATATPFGSTANVVTLGSSGQGAATMITNSNSGSTGLSNNIVVASGSGGTLLLGNNETATANAYKFTGNITLNGNLSVTSSKPVGGATRYSGVISGPGGLTTVGTGATQIGDGTTSVTNLYQGNTVLSESSSLDLADNAKLTFFIGANGSNNQITGSGQTLTLGGDFIFDLVGAAPVGSWTIVDIANLNETFSSTFSVSSFTENLNVWTMSSGPTTYTFTEATGILTAVPEPSVSLLATAGLTLVFFRTRRRPV